MRTTIAMLAALAACAEAPTPPADGIYAATWTCDRTCPPFVIEPNRARIGTGSIGTLSAVGVEWRGDSAEWSTIVATHAGAIHDDCLDVPAGSDGSASRAPYSLCTVDGGEVVGRIDWTTAEGACGCDVAMSLIE